MIVFSNTTPLISLASVDALPVLPALFGSIHVAEAVVMECRVGGPVVVPDLGTLPWIRVVPAEPSSVRSELWELDAGERQTIELALHHKADWVVLDEKIGRSVAEYLGLHVTGTLGVLLKARQQGLISSFRDTAEAMRRQGIYYNHALIARLAARVGE